MRTAPAFALLAAIVCAVTASGQADDGKTVLGQAQKALNDAPAYRMTHLSTNLDTGKVIPSTAEFVPAGALHTCAVLDSGFAVETYSDGQQACSSSGETGHFVEIGGDLARILIENQSVWLTRLLAQTDNIKRIGHEEVNGIAASIFTFDASSHENASTRTPEMRTAMKMWIADADHRPLKMESELHGEYMMGNGPATKVNTRTSSTFDYDPSIRVVMPKADKR